MERAHGPKEGRALDALTRWRRHHTRAKFEDLIEALKKIKRHDIVVEIDKVLNPPNLMEEEEQGRVLLKVVNPNVDVNVDVTFVNFAFY